MGYFDRPQAYDYFVVAGGAANPTWPTGQGGSSVSATPTGLAVAGKKVLVRSIIALNALSANAAITLLHGDGSTSYFVATCGGNNNVPGLSYDVVLQDGLAVNNAAVAGSVLIAYLMLS